jgi:hypothetical protein
MIEKFRSQAAHTYCRTACPSSFQVLLLSPLQSREHILERGQSKTKMAPGDADAYESRPLAGQKDLDCPHWSNGGAERPTTAPR